jgi:hypothetical protein
MYRVLLTEIEWLKKWEEKKVLENFYRYSYLD